MRISILLISLCVMVVLACSAQAKVVACVGASNTYGYGLPNRGANCYPAQLARMLQVFDSEWDVRNFGVSGACVLQKGMLPYVGTGAFSQARACNPDVVVIQLGGNDSVPANWMYKNDFLADFLFLIDAFAQLASHPRIYVLSSPPFYANPYGIDSNVVQGQIGPQIAQLPTYREVQIIDLYAPMEGSRDLFQGDGIHFTVEGARLVAEIVAGTILDMRGTPDFNGDGQVDIKDLFILIEHWGEGEASCDIAPGPFGDGLVDARDLEALMTYWGQELNDPTLIAHWKFDETQGTVAFDSAGENHVTLLGRPIWRPEGGVVDGALELDGISDAGIADLVLNPSDSPFSIFLWIKGGSAGQVLISQVGGANWLMADPAQGCLMTELRSAGRLSRALYSETTIAGGDWHRIGFTWDGSTRRLYVDDIAVAEDTDTGLTVCYGGLNIGAGKNLTASTFFTGLVDDVRIYNRAVKR